MYYNITYNNLQYIHSNYSFTFSATVIQYGMCLFSVDPRLFWGEELLFHSTGGSAEWGTDLHIFIWNNGMTFKLFLHRYCTLSTWYEWWNPLRNTLLCMQNFESVYCDFLTTSIKNDAYLCLLLLFEIAANGWELLINVTVFTALCLLALLDQIIATTVTHNVSISSKLGWKMQ